MGTRVTVTHVDGKWHVEGTTYIDGDANKPWPVDLQFDTEAAMMHFIEKHGWIITE